MMNRIKLYTIGLFLVFLSLSQLKGQVVFENGSLTDVLQKAKQEKKMVFMDCYTSWCGPCKVMMKEVFSREDVGTFMNSRFVCYKKDMEQGNGKELAKTYQVTVYPTFLILDTEGKMTHRMVGGMKAEEFLKNIENGIGENSLHTFSLRYMKGERDPGFVYQYIEMLSAAYMQNDMKKVLHEYWESLRDEEKCGKANWPLVKRFVYDIKSLEYQYLVDHKPSFDATVGKNVVDEKIYKDLYPLIINHGSDMIFKNRPEDSEALQAYRQLIEKTAIQDQENLLIWVDYAQAFVDNQLSKALKIYQKEFSNRDSDTRLSATLQLNGMLINKGDARLCEQGMKAIQKTMKECEWSEDNPMFKVMMEGLKKKFSVPEKR
ncbi:MAG: thioredoxin family protein [Odoribacter sp.]